MGELEKLINIGRTVENQLNEVGIYTYEELKKVGSKEAWLRIRAIDESACIHRLYALEGAIEGVKKTALSESVKVALKAFYNIYKEDTFESEFCLVTFKPDDHIVLVQWKKRACFEDYRKPTTFGLELLKRHKGSQFVIDARNGFEDEKEDVAWGFSFLLPEMAKTDCKKVAFIMKEVSAIEDEMDMWSKEFKKYFELYRSTSYESAVALMNTDK